MKKPNRIHIGIGSNQGNRIQNLQRAIDLIHARIGGVITISKLYETQAWGFEGKKFLNGCIEIISYYSTHKVLTVLLEIENSIGRVRTDHDTYSDRIIDLDILVSSEGTFETATLMVPHPLMAKRKFVLQPLSDICPALKPQGLNTSILTLLKEVSDASELALYSQTLRLPSVHYNFKQLNYIAIEGTIGAGKTSLAAMIAEEFSARLWLEQFEDNAFLPKFYADPSRYAFPLELSFLAERYQHQINSVTQQDLFSPFTISDYHISKSFVFAEVTLEKDEFVLYQQMYDVMQKDITYPDHYIYLYQNVAQLHQNIQKRGRTYESNMDTGYLDAIQKQYLKFLRQKQPFPVQILDVSDRNFVENREDFIWILEQINPIHQI